MLEMDIAFPKKKERKEKQLKQRLVICATTSWTNKASIKRTLKMIGVKEIEYVVLSTSRGGEQLALQICKELGIMVFQSHQWVSAANDFIVRGKVLRIFKPTMVIAFNENQVDNKATHIYEMMARRKDIAFKLVQK